MSILDLFQMFGRKLSDSGKAEEKKSEAIPGSLFTEAFTQVDEAYWEYIMSLLPLSIYRTVRKLIARMSEIDTDKGTEGSRVDSFRIGTLLMPNKITEEVIEKVAPGQGGKGGASKKETTTKKTDTRFDEDKDSRIKYLTRLHEVITMAVTEGTPESVAIDEVIADLEKSGFLSKGSLKAKAADIFGKGRDFSKATSHEVKAASYHLFLGSEYDKICERHTGRTREELEKALSEALVSKTAREKRELETAKKERILHAKPGALGIVIVLTAVMIAAIGLIQFFK